MSSQAPTFLEPSLVDRLLIHLAVLNLIREVLGKVNILRTMAAYWLYIKRDKPCTVIALWDTGVTLALVVALKHPQNASTVQMCQLES